MRKLLTILFLSISIVASAQYLPMGNTLQRQIVGSDTTYRFSMGSPGFSYWYTRAQVNALISGSTFSPGYGLSASGGVLRVDTGLIQTILNLYPKTDLRYYTKSQITAGYLPINNPTFSGTIAGPTGNFSGDVSVYRLMTTQNSGVTAPGVYNIGIGNDSFLADINQNNAIGGYGSIDPTKFAIQFGLNGSGNNLLSGSNGLLDWNAIFSAKSIIGTGVGGNGYLDLLQQSVSPSSVSGHLRIYADSLNRLSWKNSNYRRTFRVSRLSDMTISAPYRFNPILADSTDVANSFANETLQSVTTRGNTSTNNIVITGASASSYSPMINYTANNQFLSGFVINPTYNNTGGFTGVGGAALIVSKNTLVNDANSATIATFSNTAGNITSIQIDSYGNGANMWPNISYRSNRGIPGTGLPSAINDILMQQEVRQYTTGGYSTFTTPFFVVQATEIPTLITNANIATISSSPFKALTQTPTLGTTQGAKIVLNSFGGVGVNVNPTGVFQVGANLLAAGGITTSGTTVTGINTDFLNSVRAGMQIRIFAGGSNETRTVTSVISNTSLTTDTWTNSVTNQQYLIIGGGNRFVVLGNGYTGIGTVTPGALSDVVETLTGSSTGLLGTRSTNAGSTYNTTTSVMTDYRGYFSNTATRVTGSNALTNVGLYASASGGQNNYAAIFDQGSVGFGISAPAYKVDVSGDVNVTGSFRVNGTPISSGGISSVSNVDGTLTISTTTGAVTASLNQAAALNWTANGAASTPAAKYSGTWFTGGTIATTKPQVLIEQAGASSTPWSVNGTGFGINAPLGFTGNIFDFKINGSSYLSQASSGMLTVLGGISSGGNITTVGRVQANTSGAFVSILGVNSNAYSTATSPGTTGIGLSIASLTYTSTGSSGTIATSGANTLGRMTFASSSATTLTNNGTLYIDGPSVAGTNTGITNPVSLLINRADLGAVGLMGSTSGVININTQTAAGTYNFNLPNTVGTPGQVLTSQGGGATAMTWTTVLNQTTGDARYGQLAGVNSWSNTNSFSFKAFFNGALNASGTAAYTSGGYSNLVLNNTTGDMEVLTSSLGIPSILSTTTGINAKTVAATTLYTVPTGKTLVVTGVDVIPTTSTSATVAAMADIESSAGSNNTIYSNAGNAYIIGTMFSYPTGGVNALPTSGQTIKYIVNTAAVATTLTYTVILRGYIY